MLHTQPQIYRAIIDDVIANVAVDFEEYGMDDDLLPMLQSVGFQRSQVMWSLQQKWEGKLLETRVAEFARAPGADEPPSASQPHTTPSNGHGQNAGPNTGAPSLPAAPGYDGVNVKAEPDDPLRLRGGAVCFIPA